MSLLSCAQINAQIMEYYKETSQSIFGGKSSNVYLKTMNGVSNGQKYTYFADFYEQSGQNSIDIYKKSSGDQKVILQLQCTVTTILNFLSQDNTYFNVKLVQGNCMWGTRPSAEDGIPLGQEIELEDGIYELVWAPYNLGASSVDDGGVFFAWGENGTESVFGSKGKVQDERVHGVRGSLAIFSTVANNNDPYFVSENYKYKGSGTTTLPLEQDAAYVWWGGDKITKKDTKGNYVLVNTWRMPTRAELQYLISNNCTWRQGPSGRTDYEFIVTGKNSKTLTIQRVGYYTTSQNYNNPSISLPRSYFLSNESNGKGKVYVLEGHKSRLATGSNLDPEINTDLNTYDGASIRPVMYRKKATAN